MSLRLPTRERPFRWRKLGRVFEAAMTHGYTHGSHPCALHLKGDTFLLAFTCRDANRRSHIFLAHAEISGDDFRFLGQPTLALSPGPTGAFDCDGTISVCFVQNEGRIYLYYVGWQNLPDAIWTVGTGRLIVDAEALTLTREFPGPVFGQDKHNPLFVGATAFHVDAGFWQTWYNSGIIWERRGSGWFHRYGIHYGWSKDGVDWVSQPGLCIPFRDEHEYAFGRPTVYVAGGTYFMWFACRATKEIDAYRMGFATSRDGITWDRDDTLAGIDVSPGAWDGEMICYPYVIEHRGRMYMLYNGNGYGRTGFGLAILDQS